MIEHRALAALDRVGGGGAVGADVLVPDELAVHRVGVEGVAVLAEHEGQILDALRLVGEVQAVPVRVELVEHRSERLVWRVRIVGVAGREPRVQTELVGQLPVHREPEPDPLAVTVGLAVAVQVHLVTEAEVAVDLQVVEDALVRLALRIRGRALRVLLEHLVELVGLDDLGALAAQGADHLRQRLLGVLAQTGLVLESLVERRYRGVGVGGGFRLGARRPREGEDCDRDDASVEDGRGLRTG